MDSLNYNLIVEILAYLNVPDIITFIQLYKNRIIFKRSLWRDLIFTRNKVKVKDANKNDYDIICKYGEMDENTDGIVFVLTENRKMKEYYDLLYKLLLRKEEESREKEVIWTPNNIHYKWGKAEGLYVKAKTIEGATYTLMQKNIVFGRKIMEPCTDLISSLEKKLEARNYCDSAKELIELLSRVEGENLKIFPTKEELEEIYNSYYNKQKIGDKDTFVDDFILRLTNAKPSRFFTFPQLTLVG